VPLATVLDLSAERPPGSSGLREPLLDGLIGRVAAVRHRRRRALAAAAAVLAAAAAAWAAQAPHPAGRRSALQVLHPAGRRSAPQYRLVKRSSSTEQIICTRSPPKSVNKRSAEIRQGARAFSRVRSRCVINLCLGSARSPAA
jgi:hypothetical protein